jgi:hypothetical protein
LRFLSCSSSRFNCAEDDYGHGPFFGRASSEISAISRCRFSARGAVEGSSCGESMMKTDSSPPVPEALKK